MKNILYILLACFLFSCTKNEVDLVFDKLPEERMAERNQELRSKLVESTNGWKAYLRTSLRGGGYGFYMKFDANENVTMLSDWNNASATTVRASTYSIRYIMNTSLIFDTYNYISIMQDPQSSVNGGTQPNGLQSDIEFEYIRSTADSVILRGKKYLNYLYLVKASAGEVAQFTGGEYLPKINANKIQFASNKVNTVTINGVTASFLVNVSNKVVTFSAPSGGGTNTTKVTGFAHSFDGMILTDTVTVLGTTFRYIKVSGAGNPTLVDIRGTEYPITQIETPLFDVFKAGASTFVIPQASTFFGWGNDFVTRRATASTSVSTFAVGGSPLSLGTISFTALNTTARTLTLRVITPYAATSLTLNYTYGYVLDETNKTVKFNYVSAADANATAVLPALNALTVQRLNVDTFTLDYIADPATAILYARFTSVQNPDFVFTATF